MCFNDITCFRFNDASVLFGKSPARTVPSTSKFQANVISQMMNVEAEKPINMSESSSDDDEIEVSSDADSDFIDVPQMESDEDVVFFAQSKRPLPPPFLMNQPPMRVPIGSEPSDAPSNGTKIEVVINPGEICEVGDDIFADIFDKSDQEKFEEMKKNVDVEDDNVIEIEESPKKLVAQVETAEVNIESTSLPVETVETEIELNGKEPPMSGLSNSKIQSILDGLNDEKSSVTKMSLDDLLGTKDSSKTDAKSVDEISFLEKLKEQEKNKEKEGEKERNGLVTPTKIPQPFFVKKTPPSSKKKSPVSATKETDLTPLKVVKSLSDAFDCLPSTSSSITPEKDSLTTAADALRDKKSKEELENIAEQLNQERQDLMAERNKKDRLGVSITEQMSIECMELLRLFGVPYIVAPMEAEAQCAYLNEINLTEGTITDDSDIWLFGGKAVYKNFFDQNKHVLEYRSDNIQRLFHLDRNKLIQLAFLVGSDYTQGKYLHIVIYNTTFVIQKWPKY